MLAYNAGVGYRILGITPDHLQDLRGNETIEHETRKALPFRKTKLADWFSWQATISLLLYFGCEADVIIKVSMRQSIVSEETYPAKEQKNNAAWVASNCATHIRAQYNTRNHEEDLTSRCHHTKTQSSHVHSALQSEYS